VLPVAAGPVLAGHADGAIKEFAHRAAARLVWLDQAGRIDVVFGALPPRRLDRARRDQPRELGERGAGQCINVPRLQITARRRAGRAFEYLAHGRLGHRRVEESSAGKSRLDRLAHVHYSPLLARRGMAQTRRMPQVRAGAAPVRAGATERWPAAAT